MDPLSIILVIGIAILIVAITRKGISKSAGNVGENAVARMLRKLPKKSYFIINDLMIEKSNGRTSQIDHVVVSPYGIFVIETKNISGYIYGSEYSKQWTRHWRGFTRGGYFGYNDLLFDNPVLQNGAHVKALFEQLHYYHPRFIPIIAFSPRATLKVEVQGVAVIYWLQINDVIKRYDEEVMSIEQAQEIYKTLLSINITDKDRRKTHAAQAEVNRLNYKYSKKLKVA